MKAGSNRRSVPGGAVRAAMAMTALTLLWATGMALDVADVGSVEWIDLPKRNIVGNSHLIMMDSNSDEVAGLVQDWFQRNSLMR